MILEKCWDNEWKDFRPKASAADWLDQAEFFTAKKRSRPKSRLRRWLCLYQPAWISAELPIKNPERFPSMES